MALRGSTARLERLLAETFRVAGPVWSTSLGRALAAERPALLDFLECDFPTALLQAAARCRTAIPQARQLPGKAVEGALAGHLAEFLASYRHTPATWFQRAAPEETLRAFESALDGPVPGRRDAPDVALQWRTQGQVYVKALETPLHYGFLLPGASPRAPRWVWFVVTRDTALPEAGGAGAAPGPRSRVFELDSNAPCTEHPEGVSIRLRILRAPSRPPGRRAQAASLAAAILGPDVPLPADFRAPLGARVSRGRGRRGPGPTVLGRHLEQFLKQKPEHELIHKDLRGQITADFDAYAARRLLGALPPGLQEPDSPHPALMAHLALEARALVARVAETAAAVEAKRLALWNALPRVTERFWLISLDAVAGLEDEGLRETLVQTLCKTASQVNAWNRLLGAASTSPPEPERPEPPAERTDPGAGPAPGAGPLPCPLPRSRFEDLGTLLLDTRLLPAPLTERLLAALDERAAEPDAILVHGDNGPALRLLSERLAGQVAVTYIDPPYNAAGADHTYANDYPRPLWLSFLHDRIGAAAPLQRDGVFVVAIDENEVADLSHLLARTWLAQHRKVLVAVRHNPRGIQGRNFSFCHEYAYFLYPSEARKYIADRRRDRPDLRSLRDSGRESDRSDARSCFYPILVRDGAVVGFGPVAPEAYHPPGANERRPDGTIAVWPIDTRGREKKWRYSRQSVAAIADQLRVRTVGGRVQVYFEKTTGRAQTLWTDPRYDASEHGTKLLQHVLGRRAPGFSYPKSLYTVLDTLRLTAPPGDAPYWVLDFFAGSGTTGHAALALRRETGRLCRFVLVEQGPAFDAVLLPRLMRIAATPEWRRGRPVRRDRGEPLCAPRERAHSPAVIEVLRLEPWEDAVARRWPHPGGAPSGGLRPTG